MTLKRFDIFIIYLYHNYMYIFYLSAPQVLSRVIHQQHGGK